jgi:hypothetical protein
LMAIPCARHAQAFEHFYSMHLMRAKFLHDKESKGASILGDSRRLGAQFAFASPAARASLSRFGFEVYSTSIKARVSYDAPDAEDHTEDGATSRSKDDVTKRFIDPYDSIRMFYTTAMRRIHRGVCATDPSTQSKCVGLYPGGVCRPFGAAERRCCLQMEEQAENVACSPGPVHRRGLRWVTPEPDRVYLGWASAQAALASALTRWRA